MMSFSRSIGFQVLCAALAGLSAFGRTWDEKADFSPTRNPNGEWSYGWSTDLAGPLTLCVSRGAPPYAGTASDSRTAANCPAEPSFSFRLAMKVAYSFMKILPGGRKSNWSG